MRIFTLLYLLINYRAFTEKTPITKEIRLLLGVFLLDVFAWLNPAILFETFGGSATRGISMVMTLLELVLFSICYLKNQRQLYLNHYMFLGLVGVCALSSIGYALTQNQFVMLTSLLGAIGALIFGFLNYQYKQQ